MSTTKVSFFVVLMCYVDSEAYFGVFQHIKADVYPQKLLSQEKTSLHSCFVNKDVL